jgi:hypothetical protein
MSGAFYHQSFENSARFVRAIMTHPEFLRAYNVMPEVNIKRVRASFDAWARKERLRKRTADSIWSQVDIRSAAEFKKGIAACVDWVAPRLRGREWALVAETDTSARKAKSSAWLAGPVIRHLAARGIAPPSVIVPVEGGALVSTKHIDDALSRGITTFVHIDDAIYSGQQKGSLVDMFQRHLSRVGRMAKLYIAAAYATEEGSEFVKSMVQNNRVWPALASHPLAPLQLHFFAAYALRPAKLPDAVKAELARRRNHLWTGGPTTTILPFKVPNATSFTPMTLSYHLDTTLPQPIYKRIPLRMLMRSEQIESMNRRGKKRPMYDMGMKMKMKKSWWGWKKPGGGW